MTKHPEPRRWTLKQNSNYSPHLLVAHGPQICTDTRIGRGVIAEATVRENAIYRADIDVVTAWLDTFAHEVETSGTEERDMFADARSLLSAIFKEGGS